LEFLRKCSPASVHNLRLFLFEHGVGVNMRVGYSSFYAVRALLPISASELERDPDPTDEDVRSANERIQASGSALGHPSSIQPLRDPTVSLDTSNDILATQAGTLAPGVFASIPEAQDSVDIPVAGRATNNNAVHPNPAGRDVITFPTTIPFTHAQTGQNPRRIGGFRPAENGLVAWTAPDLDIPYVRVDHEKEEPSELRSRSNDRKDHNSKAISDLIKAYVGDRMKFNGDSYEESLLTARGRFFTLCSILDVNRYDACVAAHLPFTGTALEYYYDNVQAQASDAESVFDRMKARFQTTDVQDRALTKWQATTFTSEVVKLHRLRRSSVRDKE
jgi:hypothetical protein